MTFIAITFISISLAGLGGGLYFLLDTANQNSRVAAVVVAAPETEETDITNQVLHRYAQRAANK